MDDSTESIFLPATPSRGQAPTTLEEALTLLQLEKDSANNILALVSEERSAKEAALRQVAELRARLNDAIPNLRADVSLEGSASRSPQTSYRNSLMLLGEGSFGRILYLPTQSIVFKSCLSGDAESDTQLEHEFWLCSAMYTATRHGEGEGAFWVPRPWMFWRPGTLEPIQLDSSPPRLTPRSRPSRGDPPPSVWNHFSTPTFALDVVPSLALSYVDKYLALFVAPELHSQCTVRLLRLYLGRDDLPAMTTELQPGLRSDFPLDVNRFARFSAALSSRRLPNVETIANGMGGLLAKIHWKAGMNGRDVELVLGGHTVDSVQCYAFDFNQCQRWLVPDALARLDDPEVNITYGTYLVENGDLVPGAKRLALLISGQELYYPRPHQELYADFKAGYLEAVELILKEALDQTTPNTWHNKITRAAQAFLDEFEKIDAQKQERKGRMRRAL